jgi:hypothetical protein
MIVTLEPKEEDEIFKIGFNNIVYNFAERFFEPSDSQIT